MKDKAGRTRIVQEARSVSEKIRTGNPRPGRRLFVFMNKDSQRDRRADAGSESVPRTGTINNEDPAEMARWAKTFGVPETVLQQAIRIVGNSVAELRKLFCRD
jgi:hypothetical protein